MKKCIICWKTGAKYDLTKSDKAFASLQTEAKRLSDVIVALRSELEQEKAKPPRTVKVRVSDGPELLNQDRLMQMIRLAHPDKHGNSELANDVTKWLLSLRKKEKKSG
jgi:hypothetical protein